MENNTLSIAPEMVELSLNEMEEISGGNPAAAEQAARWIGLGLAILSAEWNDFIAGFSAGYHDARSN